MGTDIHFVVQKKVNDKWENLTVDRTDYDAKNEKGEHHYPTVKGEFHWKGDRNYYLFAWLANVRNGYGFAGVKTFEPVNPLTDNRGLPLDFEQPEDTGDEEVDYKNWLGDHSFGWATAAEILAHPRRPIQRTGVLSIEAYKALRDEGKEPESWVGDVWGNDIRVIDSKDFERYMLDPELGKKIEVRASWVQKKDYLDDLVNSMREMAEKYGGENVRIVFGFDS